MDNTRGGVSLCTAALDRFACDVHPGRGKMLPRNSGSRTDTLERDGCSVRDVVVFLEDRGYAMGSTQSAGQAENV